MTTDDDPVLERRRAFANFCKFFEPLAPAIAKMVMECYCPFELGYKAGIGKGECYSKDDADCIACWQGATEGGRLCGYFHPNSQK